MSSSVESIMGCAEGGQTDNICSQNQMMTAKVHPPPKNDQRNTINTVSHLASQVNASGQSFSITSKWLHFRKIEIADLESRFQYEHRGSLEQLRGLPQKNKKKYWS
ncbi:hypothetical protein V6N12_035313 [Hibiscus sabdariffa]|uniref:Uncharacterized protein n=1 Tax=Hibiscus sabdariffa TaxID=183260 RepID=A0ABR2BSD4_9ROSI